MAAFFSSSAPAQTDVGPACRADGGLRSVSSVFSPDISDIMSNGVYRVFTIGDLDNDSTPDLLVVDYFDRSHFVAVASGTDGEVFYTLESVAPDSFYFAVDAQSIDDVDGDTVPDILLVSHDAFLGIVDMMVISGADGHGIARISKDENTGSEQTYTVTPFSDTDKSGTADAQDIYFVLDAAVSGILAPETDLNLDGVIDSSDVVESQANAGPLSSTLVVRIANALGGTASGMQFTVPPQVGNGIVGWFKKVWSCATCLLNCHDAYEAAWACRNQLKQAECDCWDLPDAFDISACLDDLRLNFMRDCIADAAAAAGACGQCILDCHPLAP